LDSSLHLCSKSFCRQAAEKKGGKEVIAEADKMPIERTEDSIGFAITGNNPHLYQHETK